MVHASWHGMAVFIILHCRQKGDFIRELGVEKYQDEMQRLVVFGN